MNEQQLIYFRKLAESQNLSRTAAELIISPPALSATIKRLEDELGCRLFDRTGRRLRLNENGEIFLCHTEEILASFKCARDELAAVGKRTDSHLTIGITSPLSASNALEMFLKQYPEIQITHRVLSLDELSSPSLKHLVDIVIAPENNIAESDWIKTPLITDNYLMLALYPGHRFSGRKSVSLKEAAEEEFIALSRHYSFRRFTDQVFEQAGLDMQIVAECSFSMRRVLFEARYGIVITTSSAQKERAFAAGTEHVPLEHGSINLPRYIYYSKDGFHTNAEKMFYEFMLQYCRQKSAEPA